MLTNLRQAVVSQGIQQRLGWGWAVLSVLMILLATRAQSLPLITLLLFLLVVVFIPGWLLWRQQRRNTWSPAVFYFALGILILVSLGSITQIGMAGSDSLKHAWGLGLALVGVVVVARLEVGRWVRQFGITIPVALAVLLEFLLLVFGREERNGARLSLGFFQPVEYARLFFLMGVASYLSLFGERLARRRRKVVGPLALRLLPSLHLLLPLAVGAVGTLLLMIVNRDLGPTVLIITVLGMMLTAETGNLLFVSVLTGFVCLSGWVGYSLGLGTLVTRIDMLKDVWQGTSRGEIQLVEGLWALASGGWRGLGAGQGWPQMIPAGKNDLVFTAIGETLGLGGTVAVLAALAAIIFGGYAIVGRLPDRLSRQLAFGLLSAFAVHSVVIIAGNLGLVPLTGITLPFVSSGNSSLGACALLIGALFGLASKASTEVVDHSWFRRVHITNAIFMTILCLLLCKVFLIQVVQANQIALRPWHLVRSGEIIETHSNRRFVAVASRLQRAPILDRKGTVLAKTEANGRRLYPLGPAAAHVVGLTRGSLSKRSNVSLTNLDPLELGGIRGIERNQELSLVGIADKNDLLILLRSYNKRKIWQPEVKPLKTTFDATAQQVAYKQLTQANHRAGAVVVINCRSGEVLVAANSPSFDPNQLDVDKWRSLVQDSSHQPLINRAYSGMYPPGSSFKPVVASIALQSGQKPHFECRHSIPEIRWQYAGMSYSRRGLHDLSSQAPHGLMGMEEALRVSCNVYFAKLALALGPNRLAKSLSEFGFTRGCSEDELAITLPDAGYGQGKLLVSPLAMAKFMAAIANGGYYVEPTSTPVGSPLRLPVLSKTTSTLLAGVLTEAAMRGTARGIFDTLPYQVAGKTGTAQVDKHRRPHSWFVGFAPAEQPKVAFAVIVEHGGTGSGTAAPIIREVLKSLKL